MIVPNNFEYYLKNNIVKKIRPDIERAKFLTNEAEKNFNGLNKRIKAMNGIEEDNVNSIIKDIYDILMELIRAKMLLDGFSASGNYAHEAEVSYFKKLNFSDNEVAFLNELRKTRNSITYYGRILDREYAEKCYDFLKKIYPKLKEKINS